MQNFLDRWLCAALELMKIGMLGGRFESDDVPVNKG